MKRTFTALLAIVALAASPAPRASAPASATPHKAASTAQPTARPAANPSLSPASSAKPPATAAFGVWTVHMTQVSWNTRTGAFSTPSQVRIIRPGGDVTADRGNGNFKTKRMSLFGNVVLHDSQGAFDTSTNHNRAPATLTCNQLEIDDVAKVYTAIGNVHYIQADTISDSDRANLDDLSHALTLDGNVRIKQGQRTFSGDHVTYNTVSGDAHATGKDVVLTFPGGAPRPLATPRPIHLPFTKKNAPAAPSAAPSQTPAQPSTAPSPAPQPT
jgi:lipopolysaccharide assembly outer membrane protein LptD (OstA)